VLGALDCILHHQTVGEVHCLVRTQSINAKVLAPMVAEDRICLTSVVETKSALRFDILSRTSINPRHSSFLLEL
jgi:hypothetical protein